ncbi:hypothetical protein [Leuconostoc carnosum]|uniref:hypothetical protein n=1 Tax=Leuconostoc carnosum TaxID=1252 RepID=UPI000D51C165|nr:hypothetical protein [Leuconostoc carnosum]SPJ44107.1 hypothetical protein LCAC16_80191 [Leuconostoc carnosum]
MSYKVLDKNLLPVGDLILENNIGATNFWGDQVTRQLAQDDSNQDPATTMSMTVNSTDAKANNKLWNHTLSLSFDNTEDVGSKVVAQDSYLLYQDEQTGRWYLMNVYQSDEYENYRTAQAQNSAIIELSKIYTTGKTFTQARLTDIVNYVFSFVPFSAQIADDSGIILDSYTIDKATSVQAIIQDLQVKYDVDVDAFVEMDNNGRINNRVISFEHVGHNNGAKIWYGSAVKGAESIKRTGISSTLYTKFYINGVAKDGDADSGSIKSVNAGKDYIVDDTANEMYNPIGASMDVPTYLEVRLENTLLSEPTALLSWGNKIVGLFNHPRFNYVVTSMHDADYGLGDTVVVNDDSKKPALVISSRVIQIITSQASPETNTITLGEFSNLFTVKNEQATTILTLKKDINIVQIAADNAVNQAQLAHSQAVEAQSKAIVAQTSADGKTTSFTVNSIDDLPATANQGDIAWVTLSDGTHGYTYLNGKWVEDINPNLKKSIQDGVTEAVSQAKSHVEEVKQGLSSDIATAKSQAASSIQKQTATQISSALTDNNGKIISLINQDSSGVQISGKNIVLDSKVRITNEFTVGQANIANGAIGTAQIGDAQITSAKIANLDASKISGGTISGIDFNVSRRMTIASGGIIHSDVMDITKDAFNLLGMMNNTKTFVTAYNTQVSFANAVYGIDSSSGEIHSSGKITAIAQDGTKGQADFTSSYSNDHLMFSTVNWTDGSKDNFVHITDANITILSGADSADTATDYSNISPVRIRTTGDMIAGSSITSGNIQLNSYHTIISQDGRPLYVTGNGGNPVDFNVNQLTANNIVLNAAHSIISKDNGKMYFYGGNGKQVDLGVKSLTQSSLVSLKENIAEVDEFDLLHKTISADLNRYNFIGDNDKYTHVTPMIDDVNGKKYIPKEWVSEDGRSVDTYTIIGYLVGSVKALQKQINKLEQG